MSDYPGWYEDPTGRHPERYFDGNGVPTLLVRNNGVEFDDVEPDIPLERPPVPLASHRAPAGDLFHWAAPEVAPDTKVVGRKRNWWLIGAGCIVGVLLVGALTAAYLQRRDAENWQRDYHAESAKYRSEVRTANALFATLYVTRQQLSVVTNQQNSHVTETDVLATALTDAQSIATDLNTCVDVTNTMMSAATRSLSTGLVDPSLGSVANTAGDACAQAQLENASLLQALSGG
jgi:hypothetical protein